MKTCLVVDDSAVIRKVAKRILDELDIDTVEAEDGEQALVACRRRLPDVAIVDATLGELDGYDVVRALRKLPDGHAIKIIVSVVEGDLVTMARLRHAGADTHLMKPFPVQLLVEKLTEVGILDEPIGDVAA